MNYKIFFQISAVIAIILTLCICITKPQMHKSFMVYNSEYNIVESEVKTETTKELPPLAQVPQKQVKEVKKEIQTVQQETKKQVLQPKEIKKTLQKPIETQKVEVKKVQPKVEKLTATEEEIQWNKWRSNVQNQIMQDTRMPILPNGTIFKFSFEVDKYGKISNVKTWSTMHEYTPYAIQYIAPAIRSLQGRPILNFPTGSTRISTQVIGGWKIAPTVKFSTPQDYHDSEKIKK